MKTMGCGIAAVVMSMISLSAFAANPLIRLDFNDSSGSQSLKNRGTLTVVTAMTNAGFTSHYAPVNGSGFSGDFNANLARAEFGDVSGTDTLKSFTLCGWFFRAGNITSASRHLAIDYATNSGFYWDLNTSTQLVLRVNSAGVVNASASGIGLNAWTFMAVTYDGTASSGNVKFYTATNGGVLSQIGGSLTLNQGTVGENTAPLYCGGYIGNNQYFPGKLDNFRVYGSQTDSSGALSLSALQAAMDEVDCSSDTANKGFLWIVGSKNILFSEQVLRHIARTGYRHIVWGIGRDGYVDDADTVYYSQYEPVAVYQRLKELNVNIDVMCYLRHATDYTGNMVGRGIYESALLSTNQYIKNYDLTVSDLPLSSYTSLNGQVYPYLNGYKLDWTQELVKTKLLNGVMRTYTNADCSFDGLMFDNTVHTFTLGSFDVADSYESYLNQGLVTSNEYNQMIVNYRNNTESFFGTLNSDYGIPVMFNSINYTTTNYANTPQITIDRYNDRPGLFPYTTGVSIEYFGRYEKGKVATDANLLKLMSLTHDYPTNRFLYLGRTPLVEESVSYAGYQEDYDWYRYIYAQYLIGMAGTNGNSSFRYWATPLLEPYPTIARLFCHETMGDQEFDLGAPLQSGWSTNSQSVYAREFEHGLVVINPHDKGDGSSDYWKNTTGKTLYDIDGSWAGVYSNNVNIWMTDGAAKILSDSNRDTRYDRWIDFEQKNHWAGYMEEAVIGTDAVTGHKILQLNRMTNGIHQEHDIALFETKYRTMTNSSVLKIDVRAGSTETNARVIAVAEVDDTAGEYMFVAFEGRNYGWGDDSAYEIGGDGRAKATPMDSVNFRSKNNWRDIIYVPAQSWNHFSWELLDFDPDFLLNNTPRMNGNTASYAGRFAFKRWVFVRFIGGMDIDYIQAGSCTNQTQVIMDVDY